MAKLRECISASNAKKCGNESFPVLSITMKDGIVLQSDKFKKRIASADTSTYICVPYGKLVQGIHIDEGNFGVQDIVPMGIVSPAYKLWDINEEVVFPKYIEMVLRSPKCIEYYKAKLTGTVNRRGRMSATDFLDMDISLPNKEKQYQIVENMNKVNQLITLRKEQLAKLDQLVKSRFIELFESKSWETVRADAIMFNMRNGVSPSNAGHHPAKVLTLSAITQGDFDPSSWKDGMFETEPPIEKRVTSSDFYMCRGNGNKNLVGAGVYSKENRYDLVFPDTAIAATVDLQRVCLPYLFHAWKRPSVRDQIEAGARTTNGTYKINQGVVSNIELILPPIDLQKHFSAFVEQIDKSKLAIQQSLDKLELLKKSLMQEYFG